MSINNYKLVFFMLQSLTLLNRPGDTGPLSMPGLNVDEGNYIISVNGQSLTDQTNYGWR